MANLILPSRFNRQPQGAVEVDWINPLTRTLTHVYKGTEQLKNKPSDAVTYSGTAVNSVNATGRCIDTGSGGLAVIADPTSWTSPDTQKLTFSFVGEIRSVDSPYGGLFVKRKASNAAYGPMLGRDNTNDKFRVYNGNNYGIFNTLTISSLYGKQVVLTVTLSATSGTTNANIYVDGVLADTTTIAAWISTDSAGNLVIGGEQTASATYGSEISCNLLTVWNGRILSSNEIQEFSTNPWQIFRKRPNILYFDVATGGATGTGALTTGVTTASGSGTLAHTGTGSLTSGVTTLSGTGTLTHTGTGALTTSAVTLAGEGEIVGAVSGTGDLTTGVTTLSGAGTLTHTGTGSLTVGNVTLDGEGTAGSGIGIPANLEGTPTSTKIVWTWDAVSGATGYEIEYGPDGGAYDTADVGNTLTYEQTGLSASTLYEARVRAYEGSIWTPAELFANLEQGVWYDPLDIDTLYQDNAGSTAVTDYGQIIGYLRDESGNDNNATQATSATKPLYRGAPRTLGSDIAINGVFAADSDWTKGTDWTIGSGVATKTAGTAANLSQSLSLTVGVTYAIFFYITRTAGTLTPKLSGTTDVFGAEKSLDGSHVEILTAVTGNNAIEFVANSTFAGTIDNVVIKPITSFVNPGAYFNGAQRLATGNINLSAGQQMTVIAALNTSQDVLARMFFEFGNYLASTAGSIAINLNPNPVAYARGTASVNVAAAAIEGTATNDATAQIITLAVDLSKETTAEELILSSRGVYPATTPTGAEAGSSNLANGAVSIGAPKNSTQFWKGEVGRVLMVNRLLDSTEYANAVAWVKQGYVYGAALGDSTTSLNNSTTGLALCRSVPSFVGGLVSPNATSVCKPGNKIADQKTAWTAISDKTALEVVFIQVGLNDINTYIDVSKTTAQIIADLQDLVDTVNADKPTGCKTYICGLTPCKVWIGNSGGRQAACYQAWLDVNESIAGDGTSPITGVDGRITSHVAALNDGSGNLLTAYDQNGDGVHPSNEAKFIIAQAWRTKLEVDGLVG